jgi:ribosomal protein L30E
MAIKKKVAAGIAVIKKLLGSDKLLLGTNEVLKCMKRAELETVYLSKNAPQSVRDDIAHYANINGTEVVELEQPNDELGHICKKGFSISVIGVLK